MSISKTTGDKSNLCHADQECGRHETVYVVERGDMEVQFCEKHFKEWEAKYPQPMI